MAKERSRPTDCINWEGNLPLQLLTVGFKAASFIGRAVGDAGLCPRQAVFDGSELGEGLVGSGKSEVDDPEWFIPPVTSTLLGIVVDKSYELEVRAILEEDQAILCLAVCVTPAFAQGEVVGDPAWWGSYLLIGEQEDNMVELSIE